MNATFTVSCLDRGRLYPHSSSTSGQSRWGGLITSCCTRWSRSLGRVVAAHVQGSPKGGDALCVRRVISARLRSVPPLRLEVRLNRRHTFSFVHLVSNLSTFSSLEGEGA